MQKHPLLSVKEAAEALRLDERSVRERLTNGTLKGEKKMMGLREKWFVYKGAIDSALGKQENLDLSSPEPAVATAQQEKPSDQTSIENQTATLEASYITDAVVTEVPEARTNPSDTPRGAWYADDKKNLESLVETFMKPLVDKVAAQERDLAAKLNILQQQEETIKDQRRQLLLLPDLEKERKEFELRELEMIAMQKQMAALADEKAKALATKEAEVVSLLKRAEEERVAADEVKKLAESRATEIHGLTQHIAAVEEEKQILEARAAEAAKLANDLESLKKTVEELKQPWWKKWFAAGDSQKERHE